MRFIRLGKPREGRGNDSLVTISLITSLTLVCMVLVLAWGRASHNQDAEQVDGNRIVAAASQELAAQSHELKKALEDMLDGGAAPATAARLFQNVFLVDVTGEATALALGAFSPPERFTAYQASIDAMARTLRARAMALSDAAGAPPNGGKTLAGQNAFVVTPQGGYAVSGFPLSEAGRKALPGAFTDGRILAAIGFRPMADSFLAHIARTAGIATLNIVDAPSPNPATASMPIGLDGQNVYIEWRADRPGDRLLGNIGSMLVSFAALFAGLLAYRSTLKLADAELTATKLAGQDALSGIPNRLLFTSILDNAIGHAQRSDRGFALLSIDLDRFKFINDTHGHDAGDKVIIAVAHRLQSRLRATDVVARFGGDEFAVLQSGVTSPRDCEVLADRLLEALRAPFDLDGQEVYLGASIGISICPQDSLDREILMRCADMALYNAKRAGRNRYTFFETSLSDQIEERRSVEEELRLAIDNGDLDVLYQPIVSIDGRTMVAVEALVRWRHATRGVIPPSDFINLAEKRGLILQLGEWVMRRACEDAKHWPHLRVAVNVSAIQFRHPGFVSMLRRVLDDTGIDPARLELELTETIVVEDADGAENAMFDLRAMGVRLALDDFGTGYSSLIYLRRFAFDKIKIDRSFLESMEATGESAIIVHSIVHLGRSLGLTVVAEGVETSEQHRYLQALGAHELQGFMFSRPVSALEISRICMNDRMMPPPQPIDRGEDDADEPMAGAA